MLSSLLSFIDHCNVDCSDNINTHQQIFRYNAGTALRRIFTEGRLLLTDAFSKYEILNLLNTVNLSEVEKPRQEP
jgi:hypothetical protein